MQIMEDVSFEEENTFMAYWHAKEHIDSYFLRFFSYRPILQKDDTLKHSLVMLMSISCTQSSGSRIAGNEEHLQYHRMLALVSCLCGEGECARSNLKLTVELAHR